MPSNTRYRTRLRDFSLRDVFWGVWSMSRKETDGVSTNGITAILYVFWQRDLLGTPVNLLYLPKSARAYLFPQSLKNNYVCCGPISVDPVCPQPNEGWNHSRQERSCWDHSIMMIMIIIIIIIIIVVVVVVVIVIVIVMIILLILIVMIITRNDITRNSDRLLDFPGALGRGANYKRHWLYIYIYIYMHMCTYICIYIYIYIYMYVSCIEICVSELTRKLYNQKRKLLYYFVCFTFNSWCLDILYIYAYIYVYVYIYIYIYILNVYIYIC